jgi:Uma2 family endonuclease
LSTSPGGETSSRNSEITHQLYAFCKRPTRWRIVDSLGGFRLLDGSAFSPAQRRGFAPLCPDLVIELASPSDEGPASAG